MKASHIQSYAKMTPKENSAPSTIKAMIDSDRLHKITVQTEEAKTMTADGAGWPVPVKSHSLHQKNVKKSHRRYQVDRPLTQFRNGHIEQE